ncbi:laminin [Corynebacterium diphtheriae]|uniref:phage tail tape measure protein n=1 Tax=Corynebacterium diphtheriae TaxID=1717 RepID=UPI0005EADD43|nr:phage tail tape measure protein [Corynebacterium diphtheriae]KJJ60004.1 laminin [Corynebacterium diphtheriae]
MSAIGHASLPITPSLRGLKRQFETELSAPLAKLSKEAGENLKKGIGGGIEQANKSLKAAQAFHEKASKAAVDAEKAVAKAKEDVETKTKAVKTAELELEAARTKGAASIQKEEAALQKLRDSGKASAAELEAGEKRVQAARDAAAAQVAAKDTKLSAARAKLNAATDKVADSEKSLAKAQTKVAEATENITSRTKQLEKAQESATESTGKMTRGMQKFRDRGNEALSGVMDKLKAMPGFAVGAVAGFAGFAAIKTTLIDVGREFETTFNTIRAGTGASGAAFEDLKQSLRNVSGTVSAEGGLAEIGTTLADLNTRLGVTGKPLEELTRQFQNLKNLGFDADVTAVSTALNAFGLQAEEMPEAVNQLFRVSQATGVSIDDLATSAAKGGPQLKQFGFDMGESAALIGKLDKAGLDADATVGALSKAMVNFAKAGKDPQTELFNTARAVEEFIAKGDDAAAIDMSAKLFGTKGAGKFVEAVKTGALSVDDLQNNIGVTTDTINGLARELETTGQKWGRFKGQMKKALEPATTAITNFTKGGIELMIRGMENIGPAFESFKAKLQDAAHWVEDNKGKLIAFATAVSPIVVPLIIGLGVQWVASGRKAIIGAAKHTLAWLTTKKEAIAGSIANVKALHKVGRAWAKTAGKAMIAAAKIAAAWLISLGPVGAIVLGVGAVIGIMGAFFTKTETGQKIWSKFVEAVKNGAEWLKEAFSKIIDGAKELFDKIMGSDLVAGFKSMLDGLVVIVTTWWEQLKANFTAGWESIKTMFSTGWEIIKDIFATAWLVIVDLVTGNWSQIPETLRAGWEAIKRHFSEGVERIKAIFSEWLEGTKQRTSEAWETVKAKTGEFIEAIKGFFVDMVTRVAAIVAGWVTDTVAKAKEMKDRVITTVKEMPGKIKETFTNAGEWLKDAGRNIIEGLWNGLKEKWEAVRSWFSNKKDEISGFFTSTTASASGRINGHSGGGQIQGFAEGGVLPRIPGISDSVRDPILGVTASGIPVAKVEPGEFVVNRKATAKNLGLLTAINAGRLDGRQGDLGLPRYKDGGQVGASDLLRFFRGEHVNGQQAARSLEGARYNWGGVNWGDCSGAQGQGALFAVGRPATTSRLFSTANEAAQLTSIGFKRGRSSGKNAYEIGFLNGGPGGGHTSGSIFGTDGSVVNVEMGGGRGNGQIGGGAAGSRHPQYTDIYHLPLAGNSGSSMTEAVSTSVDGAKMGNGTQVSWGAAQQLWEASKKSLGLYDSGGWLPHGGVAVNLSGTPERVLAKPEFGGLDKIGTALLQLVPAWKTIAANAMKPLGNALGGFLSNTDVVRDAEKGLADTRKQLAEQATAITDAEREYAEAKKSGDSAKEADALKKLNEIREKSANAALQLEAAERTVVAARITAAGEVATKFLNGIAESFKQVSAFFGEIARFAEQVEKTREEISKLQQQQIMLRISGVKAANELRTAEWDMRRVRMQGLISVAKAEDDLAKAQRGHLTLTTTGVDGLGRAVDRFRITGAQSMEALGATFVANTREVEAAEWALQAARAKANLDNLEAEYAAESARLKVAEATMAQAQAADNLRLMTLQLQDETQRLYGMTSNQARGAQGFLGGIGGIFGGIAKFIGGLFTGAASLATGNVLGAVTAGAGAIGGIKDIVGGIGAAKANHGDFKEAWRNSTPGARAGLGLGIAGGVLGGAVGVGGTVATGNSQWVDAGNQLGSAFTSATMGSMMDYQKHFQEVTERHHQAEIQRMTAQHAMDSARLAAERAALDARHAIGKQALNSELNVADINRQRVESEEGSRQRSALIEAAAEAARARDALVAEARRTNQLLGGGDGAGKRVFNIDLRGEPADSRLSKFVDEMDRRLSDVEFNVKRDGMSAQDYSRARQGADV